MPRTLPDILPEQPRVLFVGINPSLTSAARGHHFASRTNPFWRLLHAARLVPEPITSDEDHRLAEWQLGLTNVCPRATRAADELERDEIAAGQRALARKIERVRPAVVVFVGVSIYNDWFKAARSSSGAGPKDERIAGARVFVLPNPSGLNASYPGFAHKLVWFERLREWLEDLERSQ